MNSIKYTMSVLLVLLLLTTFFENTKSLLESCQPQNASFDIGLLCDTTSTDYLALLDGDSISASLEFSSCCPSPTSNARRLFGITPEQRTRSLQMSTGDCQEYEVITPICSNCDLSTTTLTMNIEFFNPQVLSNETCCAECNCWGDPRCTAFNGTRANWVICDDRNSDCEHGPVRCIHRRDPWNQTCEYVKKTRQPDSDADQPWWYDWDTSGGPCQSSLMWDGERSPYMVMYDGEGQVINLTLGERGIISSVQITEDATEYSLTAADCFADASSDAWTITGDASVPSTWTLTEESSTLYRWDIQNLDKTVFTSIVCYKTSNERSRLDITVRQIASPTSDLSTVRGFCRSGLISENTVESRALSIEQDDACLRKELGSCVEACKALVDSSCSESNLEASVREWCSMNDLTGVVTDLTIDSVDTCISYICGTGNCFDDCSDTSENWADLVCQIDSMYSDGSGYDEAIYNDCIADIAESSWFQYVADRQAYFVRSSGYFTDSVCMESIAEYPKSKPDECTDGVQIQTQNPDSGEWEDEFFIPVNSPLCENATINGSEYPNLFHRNISFERCDVIGSECVVQNDCLPVSGIEIQIAVQTNECPPPPTQSPTPPTQSPTPPTQSPTPPTQSPTPPTQSPTPPTQSPTPPTQSPTPPTQSPTPPAQSPTPPTQSPTPPTQSPTPSTDGPTVPRPTPPPTDPPVEVRGSCLNCTLAAARSPQICVTGTTTFEELSECEQCCDELNSTSVTLTKDGYCRSQELERPYCDMSNSTDAAYCQNLEGNNSILSLNISYTESYSEIKKCCPECVAYGDPELVPFNETDYIIDAWVICDGRSIDDCAIHEDICTSQLDHAGNNCTYNKTRAELIAYGQENIGAIGSPCLASNSSPPAVMELYTFPEKEISINTTLGERAVMLDAIFTFNSATTYTLSANACFDDPGSGWTLNGNEASVTQLEQVFSRVDYDEKDMDKTDRGASRTWVLEFDNSLHIQITCQKMIARGKKKVDGITGYRLDFDHIFETDSDRATNADSTGFCPTATIDYMESTPTDISIPGVFFNCTWMRMSTALALAKSLVDPTIKRQNNKEIQAAVQTWCNTANVFQEESNPAETCFETIWKDNSNLAARGEEWAMQYCKAISREYNTVDVGKCKSGITQNTYPIQQQVAAHGTGAITTDNTCSNSTNYATSTDVCEKGFFVDYYDESSSEWVEELFIPALTLPCKNGTTINFTYEERPHLFKNRFRIRQCDQTTENGCTLADECNGVRAYTASYRFSQDAIVCGDGGGSA